jgi:hypothetical protein
VLGASARGRSRRGRPSRPHLRDGDADPRERRRHGDAERGATAVEQRRVIALLEEYERRIADERRIAAQPA